MTRLILQMAWRNLWRNRARTIISLSSVFFAGLLCLIMNAYSNGVTGYVINSYVERETGTFQIMSPEYWEDKMVDNFSIIPKQALDEISKVNNVERIAPRINSFAMGWNGTKTRPLSLVAYDVECENRFANLAERMVDGEYLNIDDSDILLGSECAKIMGLAVGDTLALVGQGYQGARAAQLFRVKGIIKSFDSLLDASVVYCSLSAAQYFLSIPDGVSTVSVLVKDEKLADQTMKEVLAKTYDENMIAMHWEDLLGSSIAGAMEEKKVMVVYFYFLYVIVFFSLLGTVIMLTSERMKEFGVMTAIGTRRSTIMLSVFVEMMITSMLGLFVSFIIATPVIANFHYNPIYLTGTLAEGFEEFGLEPILPFDFNAGLFIEQIVAVFIMSVLVCIYPINKIRKLKIIDVIRN